MIKVLDIAYARFRAPNLDLMENFLLDFGLKRSARTDNALYMRATDESHHVHITELGDPEFVGYALCASSEADLHKISAIPGASKIEDINEPGGGKKVEVKDPDGFKLEIVHGIDTLERLPVRNIFKPNSGDDIRRQGEMVRLKPGPAQCKRLGHIVLNVTDFKKSDQFYKKYFGFIRQTISKNFEKKGRN